MGFARFDGSITTIAVLSTFAAQSFPIFSTELPGHWAATAAPEIVLIITHVLHDHFEPDQVPTGQHARWRTDMLRLKALFDQQATPCLMRADKAPKNHRDHKANQIILHRPCRSNWQLKRQPNLDGFQNR
jgi:hypothetical protein